jgi:hypothetical protein
VRIAIATGLLAGALALPAGAAAHSCDKAVDFNLHIEAAHHMSCRAAAKEQRSYKGSIKRKFDTPGGFHCKRISGGRLAGQWRCHKGKRSYRFEFSD